MGRRLQDIRLGVIQWESAGEAPPATTGTTWLDFADRGLDPVPAAWFGGIAVNKVGWEAYVQDSAELGLTHIRFPGGTLAEKGTVVDGLASISGPGVGFDMLAGNRAGIAYDITHPELIAPDILERDATDGGVNDVAGLSEVFALAVERGQGVSVILPVGRYYQGLDLSLAEDRERAVAQALSDLDVFLDRLKGGAFNGGVLPPQITLEIGNEEYGTPVDYALIAGAMARKIGTRLDGWDQQVEVAVQMGTGRGQFTSLSDSGYLGRFFDEGGHPTIPELRGFDGLVGGVAYRDSLTVIDEMMIHLMGDGLAHVDKVRHHYLSLSEENLERDWGVVHQRGLVLETWEKAVRAASGGTPDYSVSAWSVDGPAGSGPLAPEAGGNMLALLSTFAGLGVDSAAIWGLTGAARHYGPGGLGTVLTYAEGPETAPAAHLLELLAENVTGKSFLGRQSVGEMDVTVFGDRGETVLYLDAGAFDGESLTARLDLREFGRFAEVETHLVGVDSRVPAVAHVESAAQTARQGWVDVTFSHSGAVVQVILDEGDRLAERSRGTGGADTLDGSARPDLLIGLGGSDRLSGFGGKDLLRGGGRDDHLRGHAGADRLSGGAGGDLLLGGAGQDRIDGGKGHDILRGGPGADVFVLSPGRDTITDFDLADRILLPENVSDGNGLPEMERLGGDLLLSLASGHVTTLKGAAALDLTEDHFLFA